MKKIITQIAKRLFGAEVEFRVKLFNWMMVGCTIFAVLASIGNYQLGITLSVMLVGALSVLTFPALLWYVTKTGKYDFGYVFSVVLIFLLFVPVTFFEMGGYHSSIPCNFVGIVVLTAFMLRGKLMVVFCVLEIILYTSLIIFGYYFPDTVKPLESEAAVAFDIAVFFAIFSGVLVLVIGLHFRIYDRDRRELIAARDRIAELSRLHHGVFTQMSHEMRTPLTVMSASAQYAVKQIERGTMDVNTVSDLKSISGEAKRLAELADNALNALAGRPGKDDSQIVLTSVDIVSLCQNVITLMSHIPQSQRPNITLDAGENIGEVQGDNRLLTQLVYNFLANAATHSGCTKIVVRVRKDNAECGIRNAELTSTSTSTSKENFAVTDGGGYVLITVEDNGKGISPELLPTIFEQGVSGEGSTGMGLHLCQEIADKHGAKISVDSEVGRGTRMSVLLRG